MIAITRCETSAYFFMSTLRNTTGGLPWRLAASESRQAVEIGMAEWIPYSRAL